MRRVLAMGAHTTLKERKLVIGRFNNEKSLIEMAERIDGSHSALKHILEIYKKETCLLVN
jgi:hypothetical protein